MAQLLCNGLRSVDSQGAASLGLSCFCKGRGGLAISSKDVGPGVKEMKLYCLPMSLLSAHPCDHLNFPFRALEPGMLFATRHLCSHPVLLQ